MHGWPDHQQQHGQGKAQQDFRNLERVGKGKKHDEQRQPNPKGGESGMQRPRPGNRGGGVGGNTHGRGDRRSHAKVEHKHVRHQQGHPQLQETWPQDENDRQVGGQSGHAHAKN